MAGAGQRSERWLNGQLCSGRKSWKKGAVRKEGMLTHFTLLGKEEAMGCVKCQGGTPDTLVQVVCSRMLWSHMDSGEKELGLCADSWQSRGISRRAGRKGEIKGGRRRMAGCDGGWFTRNKKKVLCASSIPFSQSGREQDDCTHHVVFTWSCFIFWWDFHKGSGLGVRTVRYSFLYG